MTFSGVHEKKKGPDTPTGLHGARQRPIGLFSLENIGGDPVPLEGSYSILERGIYTRERSSSRESEAFGFSRVYILCSREIKYI